MATYLRVMNIFSNSAEPFADATTNTVYFKVGPGFVNPTGEVSEQKIADDVHAKFAAHAMFGAGANTLETRVYSMEDAKPRPILATKKAAVTKPGAGVREVALCLSFKGAGTSARKRGRLYSGPFQNIALGARPTATDRSALLTMATDLANIGAGDVDWCVYSPTTYLVTQDFNQAFAPVKEAWVDDAWDTQRSRGLKAGTRTRLTLDE